MKIFLLTFALLIQLLNQGKNQTYEFELRRERILKFYTDSVQLGKDKIDLFILTAKMKFTDKIDPFLPYLDSLIQNPGVGDMFFAYQLMGLYLHCKEKLPPKYRERIKNVFRERGLYRGDTENHWLMYYIAWYLVSQEWRNEVWSNLKTSDENFSEANEYIKFWVDETASFGQMEFDSPTYIITFVPPLCILYDFAQDTLMKKRAQMMLEYLLVDYAAEYLNGCYCGGHSRDYPEFAVNPIQAQSQAIGYLYFGETDFYPKSKERSPVIFCALSKFRLPDLIYYIATDRGFPYEHRERKRVRNVIRYGRERNPAVYKYTYMTKDYCIGSLQGGILQPIQQHTWDITFSNGATVFSVHPYFSEYELGMFFPEEVKILPELVDRAHRVYRNPDKWTSSSPYERIFQYRGSLIALYGLGEMREGERYRQVNIFIPRGVDEFEMDTLGWMVGRVGCGYFGIRVVGGIYDFVVEQMCYRVRVYGDRVCVIVEAGSSDEFGDFDVFRSKLKGASFEFDIDRFELKYRGVRGFEMRFDYFGGRYIDGVEYRLDWGLFEGEFVRSELKSKVIEINYKGKKRILDFNKLEINEK
jgi:hypothetical protein